MGVAVRPLNPDGTKTCVDCGRDKDPSRFPPRRRQCLDCKAASKKRAREANPAHTAAILKAWKAANPDKVALYQRRKVMKKYGLTTDDWDRMFAAQGGTCAVCRGGDDRTLHVDHNHVTGVVRALLCWGCNVAIAMAGESSERLRLIASYLEEHDGDARS